MRTIEPIPARAAWAATELARLPVEAQAATLKPSWRALVRATETTRSLNDPVGLAVSFLIHSSPSPSSAASRSARTSGVNPAPRSTGAASSTGSRSPYRQMVRGPGLDPRAGHGRRDPLVVVVDLERPEAEIADVQRLGRVLTPAFPTAQTSDEAHEVLLIGRALAPGACALVAAASQGPSLSRSG